MYKIKFSFINSLPVCGIIFVFLHLKVCLIKYVYDIIHALLAFKRKSDYYLIFVSFGNYLIAFNNYLLYLKFPLFLYTLLLFFLM